MNNLPEWLRGGQGEGRGQGGFKTRVVPAAYARRPKVGIEIGETTAALIGAASVAIFSLSMPPVFSAAQLERARRARQATQSFWLTRIVFLRSLAFVYFTAFLVSFRQSPALLGDNGLLPVRNFLARLRRENESSGYAQRGVTPRMLNEVPTLLWFADQGRIDPWLRGISLAGMALSAGVLLQGGSNVPLQLALWLLYHSIVAVGQRWYSFGWESQLLETGFLSIFLVPMLCVDAVPAGVPAPWAAVWALRWLTFRIMLGAGMIKIRGDSCWRDLTAMVYHYQTQPVPNPLSWFLHHSPVWFHKFETAGNHLVELAMPFFVLAPWRPMLLAGGLVQIIFQVILILSGNLSFLNWLTILPAVMCLDDAFLSPIFSSATAAAAAAAAAAPAALGPAALAREGASLALATLVVMLSVPVVRNILSPNQIMNTSFDAWRLVNTYGAFGSITREREEVILQGTRDDVRRVAPEDVKWEEYEFKVKPGSLARRPAVISPYHYRLDWLMWFLPFGDPRRNPWFYHLIGKLLVNDAAADALIARNPFAGGAPPKFVRAELYRYEFTKPGSPEAKRGDWWTRTPLRTFVEAQCWEDLRPAYRQFGWPVPASKGAQ